MKTTTLIMKCILILLMLTSWASFAPAQIEPSITVKKKMGSTYSTTNIAHDTTHVLAGQRNTFKIKIEEPDKSHKDFFSQSDTLMLFVPDRLSFTETSVLNFGLKHTTDLTVNSELDSIFVTNDTLVQNIVVSEDYNNEDYIEMKDLIIAFPSDLENGEIFTLKAIAGFMDTDADTTMNLITFEYQTPTLALDKNETACPGKQVECTLDITPANLTYELIKNDNPTGIMVDSGDVVNFDYEDEIYVKDTGNTNTDGQSESVTIDDDFFQQLDLQINDGSYEPDASYCKGKEIGFELQGLDCFDNDVYSYHLYFKEEGSTTYEKVEEVAVGSSFSYAPPGNGSLKVRIEEGEGENLVEESNEVTIGNILVMENHYDFVQDIRLSPSQGKRNMFNEFTLASDTLDADGSVTAEINGLEYYKENIEDTADYRFGRFVFDYKGDDTTAYSFFDPNDEGVGGTGNGVTFKYGRYFSGVGEHCFDSTEAMVEVDRAKIFLPQEHYCANDDSSYEMRIDTTKLPFIDVGDDQETIITFKGYSVKHLNESTDSNNIEEDNIIEFVPYNWQQSDVATIEIKAFADVIIRDKAAECPDEWQEYPDDYTINESDYEPGDRVVYFNALWECNVNGTIERPGQGSDWSFINECFYKIDDPRDGDSDLLEPLEVKDNGKASSGIICDNYDLWQSTPQDPTYTVGDSVMNNGKQYKCIKNAYPIHEPQYSSNYWDDLGSCGENADIVSEFNVEYASVVFYVYQPEDDGVFIELDTLHGISNEPITLRSNYDIENVNNGGGGIVQDGEVWTFIPEKLLGDTTLLDSANLELVYSDDHGCKDTSDFKVYVGEEYNPGYPDYFIEFNNLDTAYCAIDTDYQIEGNFRIDSLSGYGVSRSEENDYFFNPREAIDSGAGYNVSTPLYIEIRDNDGYWRRDSFDMWVNAQPRVQFTGDDVCFGDTARFDNQTVFEDETDSLTWHWSFGDFTSVSNTELITDTNPVSGQPETASTAGTYKNPLHEYSDPGVYKAELNVVSKSGCADQYTDTIVVGEYPQVDFEAEGHVHGYPTTFDNFTGAAQFDTVSYYVWQYEDVSPPDTMQETFSEHTFTSTGVHNVILTAITQVGCASSDSLRVPVFDTISVTGNNPYHAKFDNSDEGWLPAHSFDKGLPSGWELKEIEGPFETESNFEGRIWQTANPEYNIANERSWVESPCFILDDLEFPLLSVDIYQSVEEGRDGAVLQYSLNDGESWQLLSSGNAAIDEGLNWYNTSGIVSNPGDQQGTGNIGWSANTKKWHTSRFPLDQVKEQALDSGATCVRFRMTYASDGGTAQGYDVEGFAFDNFYITSRSRVVMLEQFVNSAHNKDLQVSEEAWLDDFMETRPVEAVDMRYHNYISHDYDPLYYLNPPDISARSMEYRAMQEELTMVDGIHRCLAPAEDSVRAYYNMRTLKDKRFDIDVQTSKRDGALHVKAEVTKLTDTLINSEGTDMAAVRMGLVQKKFEHEGSNYKNIVVELLPDGVGNVVATVPDDFPKGETITAEAAWHPGVTTIGNEFRLVVYVQGVWGRDEVHQVWFTDLDEELVPRVEVDDPFFDPNANLTSNVKENELREIDIYPIPVKDRLNIEWKHALKGTVRWKLISMSGRVIKQKETPGGMSRESINMANVEDGVYILVMYDEESSRIDKWKIVVAK